MKREQVIKAAVQGLLSNQQAADLLGIQSRQVRRVKVRYRAMGAAGMEDGRNGKRPRRQVPKETAATICRLQATRYAEFSVQHSYEYLQDDVSLPTSPDNVSSRDHPSFCLRISKGVFPPCA